jgi:hypothetical protein
MTKQISDPNLAILQEEAFHYIKTIGLSEKMHFSLISHTGAKNVWYEKDRLWKQFKYSLFWIQ